MAARKRRGWGWIRRLPSKRYQASYVGPDVRRYTGPTTFTVRMDAEGWLATERRLIEGDEWTPPTQRSAKVTAVTLVEYATNWIAHRNIKVRTRIHYTGLLKHLASLDVPIKSLTPEKVRAWHSCTLTDRPTMRAHAYGLLHAILATAVTDGLILSNPCNVPRAMRAQRKRAPVLLTASEVAAVGDTITPERFRALVLINAWCGLRWGEVTELRRKDIGEGCEAIKVSRGVTHRKGCHLGPPKSGKGRVVVVPPHIRADLKAHLDDHVEQDPEALLFPPVRGGCHLKDKPFSNHYLPALKAVGREGVCIHDLRHFAGTQNARVGNVRENMDRLGHSTVAASLVYQQVAEGRDAAVAEGLSRLAEADNA